MDFNPQGPRGPRQSCFGRETGRTRDFNPQGPRGPRRCAGSSLHCIPGFQSTRPSRASTSAGALCFLHIGDFNPQGPRGPRLQIQGTSLFSHISIHKALAGLDGAYVKLMEVILRFQSTRPSRASTDVLLCRSHDGIYFNPQGPRGPRPFPLRFLPIR